MNSKALWGAFGLFTAIGAVLVGAAIAHVEARFDRQDERILDLVERVAAVQEKLTEKVVEVERDVHAHELDAAATQRELTDEIRSIQKDLEVHKAQSH